MKKQWSTIKEGIIQRKKVIMTVSMASVLLFGGAAEPTDGWEKR